MLPNGRQTNATRDHGCRLSGDEKRSLWRAVKRIKSGSPLFFEHLVVELLVAMGYGGSHQDAGEGGPGGGHDPAGGRIRAMYWILGRPSFSPGPGWRISYQICLNPIKGSPRCIQATPALRGPRALPRGGPEARLASPTKKIVCVDLN